MSEQVRTPTEPGKSTNQNVPAWRAHAVTAGAWPLRVCWVADGDADVVVTVHGEDAPLWARVDDTLGESAQRGVLPGQTMTFVATEPCVVNVLALGRGGPLSL